MRPHLYAPVTLGHEADVTLVKFGRYLLTCEHNVASVMLAHPS